MNNLRRLGDLRAVEHSKLCRFVVYTRPMQRFLSARNVVCAEAVISLTEYLEDVINNSSNAPLVIFSMVHPHTKESRLIFPLQIS